MRFSEEEKERLLEGWRESGKSISAYVREKGLVRWTFHKWLKAEKDAGAGFVQIPESVLKTTMSIPEILIEKGDVKIHIPLSMSSAELCAVMARWGAAL